MTAVTSETPSAATAAVPVRRGCGLRLEGGTYWEYGLSPRDDLADFLIDVPIPLPTLLDLAAVGVKMIERGGVSHVVDWVGAEFYPNVADLLEEARRFGLSRRLSGSLDYARLTPSSRILLVHARAHVANSADFGPYPCPVERHRPDTPACAGVWWRDLDGGTPLDDPAEPLAVLRRLPSCTYRGQRRPEGVTPCYRPAFFASFPASRLVVVRGADGRHAGALARARRAGLPVVEVEA